MVFTFFNVWDLNQKLDVWHCVRKKLPEVVLSNRKLRLLQTRRCSGCRRRTTRRDRFATPWRATSSACRTRSTAASTSPSRSTGRYVKLWVVLRSDGMDVWWKEFPCSATSGRLSSGLFYHVRQMPQGCDALTQCILWEQWQRGERQIE